MPVPLSETQNSLPSVRPHGLTRFASVCAARPGMSETRSVLVYEFCPHEVAAVNSRVATTPTEAKRFQDAAARDCVSDLQCFHSVCFIEVFKIEDRAGRRRQVRNP